MIKKVAIAAALVLAVLLPAYWNSFGAAFQFDDYNQINENPYIRDIGNVPRFFTDASIGSDWTEYVGLKGYRPLVYTSFALNYAIGSYHVRGYHVFNFILHFLDCLLVFLLVSAVLKAAGRGRRFLPALAVTLLFAAHPIQTDSVTYISGRAEMLASFFYIAAFLCFVKYRSGDGRGSMAAGLAAPLLFLLALLSKEMAVSLIAVMAAFDLLFTVPKKGGVRASYRIWLYYLLFIAILAGYVLAKQTLQGFVAESSLPFGVKEYLMSEAKVLLLYVRLLILPFNQNADYNLPISKSPDALVAVSAALVCTALYVLYRARRKAPEIAFFGLWFFLALAPESTLVPIPDIAVEYRLYLPSAGFIAALVLPIARLSMRGLAPKAAALTITAVVLMAVLTFNRNVVWSTGVSFWKDAKAKAPWSDRARANLGKALMDEGRYADAAREIEVYLNNNHGAQTSYIALNNLGVCYGQEGLTEKADSAFRAAAMIFPDNPEPYENLAWLYKKEGRPDKARDALLEYARVKEKEGGK